MLGRMASGSLYVSQNGNLYMIRVRVYNQIRKTGLGFVVLLPQRTVMSHLSHFS